MDWYGYSCVNWERQELKWNRRSAKLVTREQEKERTVVSFRHLLICLFMNEDICNSNVHLILLICFFGLLRISNVGIESIKRFDPTRNIQLKDVSVVKNSLRIYVKWSKTSQTKGEFLWLLACKTEVLCPLRTWTKYRQKYLRNVSNEKTPLDFAQNRRLASTNDNRTS